ncbi:MCE family protein [Haloechinothrix sp. YIM 98757]|uniref:MCE family protein n=1 Tax=Haloechinothrix aidingensis TaxID=2752311 RepID=A0A838ACP4_9PSEU|nr:MlaD family protein [Haloechinothrix aidingensis]MBA0126955.1 MCE family protein [Haloechinothrix aidingensis]
MLTRNTRIKLAAFFVIATLSVAYVGLNYAGLDRLFGPRGYVVTAQFADSGGIFEGAQVAYRGVEVGEVASLRLSEAGIDVDLDISDDAPPIPADTTATVTNRSAVGEQYVDLRPQSGGEPYLEDGSVISQDDTGLPVPSYDVLTSLDELVSSVDTESLRTVVTEADLAFSGAGQDMQVLLDTAHSFTERAQESLPETRQLLTSGRTVLDNQRRNADDITEFSSGLKDIAEQFAESDSDIRKVIDRTPQVGQRVSEFLRTSGNDMGLLLANLLTTADIMEVRTDSTEQMMVNFSMLSAFPNTVSEDGKGKLGLVFNFFDPPSCMRGYEGTEQRPANDFEEIEPNTDAYCAEPPGSPVAVRGSQNAPYKGEPVEVAEPGGSQGDGQDAGQRPDGNLPGLLDLPTQQDAPGDFADLLGVTD